MPSIFEEITANAERAAKADAIAHQAALKRREQELLIAEDERLRGITPKKPDPDVNSDPVGVLYNPVTGAMTPTPHVRLGVAEVRMPSGKTWRADHVAHFVMGHRPPRVPVHKDGDPANLAWANIYASSPNNTGHRSIYLRTRVGKAPMYDVIFMPRLWKQTIYIGSTESIEASIALRDAAMHRWDYALLHTGVPKDKGAAVAILKGE